MQTPWGLPEIGLGLRKKFLPTLMQESHDLIQFLEIAPENWMDTGGARAKQIAYFASHYPIVAHGLSLSLGAPAPLDIPFLKALKRFLDTYQIECYSEHLSYCGDDGMLYDLMPIPFTEEAVYYVSQRIRQVQDTLERQIAIENISYYLNPAQALSAKLALTESEFIRSILKESGCKLLLDVNNIHVNATNHHYDSHAFLASLVDAEVAYIHIAGHDTYQSDILIDTHGEKVIPPVWALLSQAYQQFGRVPTLLERDSNIPPLSELLSELAHIKAIGQAVQDVT